MTYSRGFGSDKSKTEFARARTLAAGVRARHNVLGLTPDEADLLGPAYSR